MGRGIICVRAFADTKLRLWVLRSQSMHCYGLPVTTRHLCVHTYQSSSTLDSTIQAHDPLWCCQAHAGVALFTCSRFTS